MAFCTRAKYLITGACGQLGGVLGKNLRSIVGKDNVILSDIKTPSKEILQQGPFVNLDVCDEKATTKFIVENKIDSVIHLAALLSASGEKKLRDAFQLNVHTLTYLFLLAKQHNLQLYIPSTVASFGPDSPLNSTPDKCIQRPTSLYGVSKVYCERLGEYFNSVHGVDFRCLRYPSIISATEHGGGTAVYAVDVFVSGIRTKAYECYLEPDTRLSFAHVDDAMENTVKFILSPDSALKQRTYNYSSFTMTPNELFESLRANCIPDLKITYKIDPLRQRLANSWPKTLDFSNAVRDWNLTNKYDLDKSVRRVYKDFKEQNI